MKTALRLSRHDVVVMSLFGNQSKPNFAPVGLILDRQYPLFFSVMFFFS